MTVTAKQTHKIIIKKFRTIGTFLYNFQLPLVVFMDFVCMISLNIIRNKFLL